MPTTDSWVLILCKASHMHCVGTSRGVTESLGFHTVSLYLQ